MSASMDLQPDGAGAAAAATTSAGYVKKVLMMFGSSNAGSMLSLYKPMYQGLDESGALDKRNYVIAAPAVDVRFQDLRPIIEREQPDVVHLAVHGPRGFDDVSDAVTPEQMAAVFEGTGVRLVVLMGANTHEHAVAIAREGGVAYVYGQAKTHVGQAPFTRHMIAWTYGFYGRLGQSAAINADMLVEAHLSAVQHVRRRNEQDERADVNEGTRWLTAYRNAARFYEGWATDDEAETRERFAALLRELDPSVEDNELFRHACEHGNKALVEMLLADPRVDPTACGNEGLSLARRYGHADVVALLQADPRVAATTW